jgi:hypothetical protein
MVSREKQRVWYEKDNEKLIQVNLFSSRRVTAFFPNRNEYHTLHQGDRYKMCYFVHNLEYYCSFSLTNIR